MKLEKGRISFWGRDHIGSAIARRLGPSKWQLVPGDDVYSLFRADSKWDLAIVDVDNHELAPREHPSNRNRLQGTLEWLHAHYWHVPVVLITRDRDPRQEVRWHKAHVREIVTPPEIDLPGFEERIEACVRFTVLVADVAGDAPVGAIRECDPDKLLRIESVAESLAQEIVEQCKRRTFSAKGLESVAGQFWSYPDHWSLLVGTQAEFLFFGKAERGEVYRVSREIVDAAVKGFPEEAVWLYRVVQAALVGGAGLQFHRKVEGCPLDFAVDKLDVPRGMTSGVICDDCRQLLDRPSEANRVRLTPLQIEAVKRVLTKVKELSDARDEAPAGIFLPADVTVTPVRNAPAQLDDAALENLTRAAKDIALHHEDYSSRKRVIETEDSFFFPARHYNSQTPTIPGGRAHSRRSNIFQPAHYTGGGYFLVHGGFGVVVDPGYNFLQQIYDTVPPDTEQASQGTRPWGYTVEDIDVVIVTHNHWDHHADLETILRSRRSRPLWVYCPKEVAEMYDIDSRAAHSAITWQRVSAKNAELSDLPPGLSAKMRVRLLPTLHWQHTDALPIGQDPKRRLESHLAGFGVYFELTGWMAAARGNESFKSIAITSDTLCPIVQNGGTIRPSSFTPYLGAKHWSRLLMTREDWTPDCVNVLREAYHDFREAYAKINPDIVCAHIGTLERRGWDDLIEKRHELIEMEYSGHHLGMAGCLRLMNMMDDKGAGKRLVLLSEFGEELIGHREHLSDVLESVMNGIGAAGVVLPADSSLAINLVNRKIRCSRCDNWHDYKDVKAVERESDIISYVSRHAVVSPNSTCDWK